MWHVMDPIRPLSPDAARELFSGHTTKRESLVEGLEGTLNQLLHALDYIPESIVLMASYAQQNYTISEILEIWQRGFIDGTEIEVEDYNDPMSILNNTITSYLEEPMILSPHVATLLRVVSMFPRGVDESDIQSLIPSVPNAGELARKLSRGSLLKRVEGKYTMYPATRLFMYAHYTIDSTHDEHIHNYHLRLICDGVRKPGDPHYSLENALKLQDEETNVSACLMDGIRRNASRWAPLAHEFIDYRDPAITEMELLLKQHELVRTRVRSDGSTVTKK